ncbi:MAG: hypothetical protein J5744_00655, partial [Oscillospiraceae bacterium]|nr:hypothetical protein [Oscillospiraceae bacterium]
AAASAGEDTTVVEFKDEEDVDALFRFCTAGEYKFIVREVVETPEEGMVYDDADRVVIVKVSESGSKGLKAEVYVDDVLIDTFYSADTTNSDNEPANVGRAKLCTITNRFAERENPKTGVPAMFSIVDLLTVAGLGIVLKRRFF